MTGSNSSPDAITEELKREREMRARLERERDDLIAALSENHTLLVELERQVRSYGKENSRTAMRIAAAAQKWMGRAAPEATRRGRAAHLAGETFATLVEEGLAGVREKYRRRRDWRRQVVEARDGTGYQKWLAAHEPSAAELARQREVAAGWTDAPLISILMPVYNPKADWLSDALASVLDQTYPHWELCVADDCSSAPHVREQLDSLAARDPRVKVVFRDVNGGISFASKSALDLATGEFIGFLDHDDILRPHALFAMATRAREVPDADVIYSDEEKLLLDGTRGDPTFKPEWSPALLLTANYLCHFTVIRRQVALDAGGFRLGYDGSQDHDLFLRATERARRVEHVADVLYTWRMVPGSAALAAGEKPYAHIAGMRAVASAMRRRKIDAEVEDGPGAGMYYVRYAIQGEPSVDIVIPTRDRADLLRECISSIEKLSTYRNYRIVVVDNDSSDPATLRYFDDIKRRGHAVVAAPGPFNYSSVMNRGIAQCSGEYILMLNNDIVVRSRDWIEAMLRELMQADVGAVGARLLFPSGGVQHEGIRLGAGHVASNIPADPWWATVRERSAVTAACLIMRRETFEHVGGFDEELAVAFNDVDLCLRLRKEGFRILCTPQAELLHHEGASRSRLSPAVDTERFEARWGTMTELSDPYVSPHVRTLSPLVLETRAAGSTTLQGADLRIGAGINGG